MADSLTTRPSLLVRACDAQDTVAWGEFVELYAPLIHHFCRKQGLQEADAADVTQEVLGRVARAVPQLEYDPERGSFRGWLFTAVRNRLRDFYDQQRRQVQATGATTVQRWLDEIPSRERSLEDEWEQEYRRRLYLAAARIVRRDVTETTWRAFSLTVVEGQAAAAVAAELGLSVASVYLAKSRVMARLRAEVRLWEEQNEGGAGAMKNYAVACCPDVDTLAALLEANLPEARQTELTRHLDGCARCQLALQELAADARSWRDAAESLSLEAEVPTPALKNAIAHLKAKPGAVGETRLVTPLDTAPDLAFLEPPTAPGELGRLKQYRILGLIGRGGFGLVLKALDEPLQRVVAIKVLAPTLAASGVARQRFLREAQAAAAVIHENVITIHAVDEFRGVPYLVMQYVAGVSLQERLDQEGALSVGETLRIGIQVAEGLAVAHQQGLVHRDIKPGNILLENGVSRVKLTDFGLARAVGDAGLTQSGMIAGTPQYMAPEQARGETPIDHRADLFSLGSVLYSAATGRLPFRAETIHGVLHQVIEKTPRSLRAVNPELPAWLDEIIARLHAKNPARRFQSAAEVAEVLRQHLAHLQEPQRYARPTLPRLARPWRGMATGVVCGLCLTVLGAATLLWLRPPEPPPHGAERPPPPPWGDDRPPPPPPEFEGPPPKGRRPPPEFDGPPPWEKGPPPKGHGPPPDKKGWPPPDKKGKKGPP